MVMMVTAEIKITAGSKGNFKRKFCFIL